MQSSGHAESQGLLSLFLSLCWKTWTCPDQPWTLGLWRKPSWILDSQSLVMCPAVPQKRQSLLSRWHCHSCGVSFPSFPSFKERSGVVDFFCWEVEPLPWVEPELLLFCLDWEEPLPDLWSDLDESDFCLDLVPEDPEAWVLWETSAFHSQYYASIAWMSFWSPVRVVGLL